VIIQVKQDEMGKGEDIYGNAISKVTAKNTRTLVV
jgi:hypothetical protein